MICEECGNEHDGSYGSGRFCSNHCRHVYIGKQTKRHVCNFPSARPSGNWKCSICSEIFRTRRDMSLHNQEVHGFIPGTVWNKGLTKETDVRIKRMADTIRKNYDDGLVVPPFKGKHHSVKTRKQLSKIQKENFKKGINKGWSSRKIVSFPESFWKRVLDNNGITYQFQLRVSHSELGMKSHSCYFLDFGLPGKVDLEIDGAQHRFRTEYDEKRNKNLENNGWIIYRVKWNDVQSQNGKMEMKKKIDVFLTWYKNFSNTH